MSASPACSRIYLHCLDLVVFRPALNLLLFLLQFRCILLIRPNIRFLLCRIFGFSRIPKKWYLVEHYSQLQKSTWDRGISVNGAFKLDPLQPIKQILLLQFSICLIFTLGGQFLLPQRANSEKREFSQLQKSMRQGSFSDLGIQTGLFAAH